MRHVRYFIVMLYRDERSQPYGTENSQLQGRAEVLVKDQTFDNHGYGSTSPGGLLVMSQTDTLCMPLEYNNGQPESCQWCALCHK